MVRALGADICALQEIAHECPQRGALAQVAEGARLEHVTFEPHARYGRAPRGVGVLHRHPPLARGGGRLPARAGDDKGFTRVVLAIPSAPDSADAARGAIEVIAVHLDPFSHRARQRQIAVLATAVGAPTMPRIVLGDFNAMTIRAWLSRRAHDETVAEVAEALSVEMPSCASRRSFPSRYPLFAIDWVLASSELEVRSVEVVATRLSDHAALLAEVAPRG